MEAQGGENRGGGSLQRISGMISLTATFSGNALRLRIRDIFDSLEEIAKMKGRRLINMSVQLKLAIIASKSFIDKLTRNLWEIWQIFEEANDKWKALFPLIYGFFLYQTCLYVYIALFVRFDIIFRVAIAIFAVTFFIGALIVSWALSIFTSIIYDSFINIGKYNSVIFPPTYRFKIICFMKRFGGRPFGISMWGFFYVKRNFLIRINTSYYSVFFSFISRTQYSYITADINLQ
ncbi:uncharacterized protein LOC111635663 [Centruroides sculpturatus]|uniref:uncharacterized protein LOC111635663 n=1 Tax=Centruroides sculpturatus TaxID=218467 RepID=UPI000C6CD6C0|nr:uncharacterized protein LOC111635663 [Centruroides sculpturatus]